MPVRIARPALPDAVTAIARRLESTGRGAWLTGECLADRLCGRPRRTFSLSTTAPPEEIAGLLETAVPTATGGLAWQVPTGSGPVDVLPIAADGSLEDALRARGLGIWAMAWSPIRHALEDPFGGRADLEARRLRLVDPSAAQLGARPGLALAVARLVAQHGDRADADLERALERLGPADLERQAAVFRGRSIRALLAASGAGEAVALLSRTGLDATLGARTRPDTPALLARAPRHLALRLAIWLRGSRPGRFMRRHRIHPELGERVIGLLAAHPIERQFSPRRRASLVRLAGLDSADRDALFWLRTQELAESADKVETTGARQALEALRSALADHEGREAEPRTTPGLALGGREVMALLGVGPGPLVGRALVFLRDRVASEPELNEPTALRAELAKWAADRNDEDARDGGHAAG